MVQGYAATICNSFFFACGCLVHGVEAYTLKGLAVSGFLLSGVMPALAKPYCWLLLSDDTVGREEPFIFFCLPAAESTLRHAPRAHLLFTLNNLLVNILPCPFTFFSFLE